MAGMTTELVNFMTNHWGLCFIFIFAFGWVVTLEMQARLSRGVGLSTQELTRQINDDDALVVDVRSEKAFAAGHILSAKHIAADKVSSDHKSLKNLKASPFILVCDYGVKGAKLANKLRKEGFEQAHSLNGGMEAWKKAELPLVSK